MSRTLCAPAAAISSARFAVCCPFTSRRSGPSGPGSPRSAPRPRARPPARRRPRRCADHRAHVAGAEDVDALHHRCLAGVGGGHHQRPHTGLRRSARPRAARPAPDGGSRPGPAHPRRRSPPPPRVQVPRRRQQPHGDGQVEGASLLAHVRGGEVHGDAPGRKRDTRRCAARPPPAPGPRARPLRQPHHRERGEPGGEVDLHLDEVAVHAADGGGQRPWPACPGGWSGVGLNAGTSRESPLMPREGARRPTLAASSRSAPADLEEGAASCGGSGRRPGMLGHPRQSASPEPTDERDAHGGPFVGEAVGHHRGRMSREVGDERDAASFSPPTSRDIRPRWCPVASPTKAPP